MLGEFDLIRAYFQDQVGPGVLGVGDDAARMPMPPGEQIVVCKDLLIEGRHFFPDVDPETLGHKALAVNLSDLAAMGSKPLGFLLGIGLPEANPQWLAAFSRGMLALGHSAGCPLIGGDTVRVGSEKVISITALGTLPAGQPGLLRQAAKDGDDVWVSGSLGAAHVALLGLQGDERITPERLGSLRPALEIPQPRLALGQALLGIAHAAIDVSDGLVQDLGHVLQASGCGAVLESSRLPIDVRLNGLADELRLKAALSGGDDYELCFTAPLARREDILTLARSVAVPVTRIGRIHSAPGLTVLDDHGQPISIRQSGFDHFGPAQDDV